MFLLLSLSCFDFAVDGIPNSPRSLCFCCCLLFSCKNIFITNKLLYYYYYCLFPDICTIYVYVCMYVCISYAKGNGNIRKPPEKRGPFTRKKTKTKKNRNLRRIKKNNYFSIIFSICLPIIVNFFMYLLNLLTNALAVYLKQS